MGKGNTTDKTVTIQTTEGCYEETLSEDNTNNFPIQEQLKLTRYRISKPPMMMRNIPMYHTEATTDWASTEIRYPQSRPRPTDVEQTTGRKRRPHTRMYYRNNRGNTGKGNHNNTE